jgi:DNA-binding response OmpR family regulator
MPDRVAIVEDDPDQRALLERGLRRRGFSVVAYADRAGARSAFLAGEVPELAILDVNLDGEDPADRDGFELCREMAAIPRAAHVPVIFLTRLEDHRDQLEGLTLAVDYLQKPPDVELLSARVRSLLAWSRRLHGDASEERPTLTCGALRVDLGSNRALWKDRDLGLSYCEFEILRALAERPGRVATYVDLCEALGSNVADNTIATHVQNIRTKFTRVDPQFSRTTTIRAVPRRGYAWETPTDIA